MDIFKKTALCVLVSASLIACGGGGGDSSSNSGGTTGTTYKIESGAFQKGPFIAGTTVTIQELDDELKPTGVTYTTVTDDSGRFSATNIKSRFVEVFANGFYFDELTGTKSVSAVTLRAILDLTISTSKPSINTLTTMQVERLRQLKSNGKTFQEAESDSKDAVLGVFGLSSSGITRLDSIDLMGASAGDEALLKATVSLLQVATNQGGSSVEAELTALVANLSSDLKGDGQANGVAKGFVSLLQNAQSNVNTSLIRLRLQEYLQGKTNTPTNADTLAKATAAFMVAKSAFGRSLSFGGGRLAVNLTTDNNPISVFCNLSDKSPKFTILANINTVNTGDGTLTHEVDCPHGEYVAKGKIIRTCNNADCSSDKTEAVNFSEGVPSVGFYPTINGVMEHSFVSNLNNDIYKGSVKLDKNGAVTIFSFPDGLFASIEGGTAEHGATYKTATGKMAVTGGNASNCMADGVFSYEAILPLVNMRVGSGFESGSLKIKKGATEIGTVTFNSDGGIKVKTPTESEKTFSKSDFLNYCGGNDLENWKSRKFAD